MFVWFYDFMVVLSGESFVDMFFFSSFGKEAGFFWWFHGLHMGFIKVIWWCLRSHDVL